MFKIVNCEQKTPEWFKARIGKWTASSLSKAITPSGSRSTSISDFVNRLVAETITGEPDESFTSDAMERGSDMEEEAFESICFVTGIDFEKVGLLVAECDFMACSPDGLADRMGLELKCPSAHTHLAYISAGGLPPKYKPQVQGSMAVTGKSQWLFASYHPEFPPLIVVVDRDEDYISRMRAIINDCREEYQERLEATRKFIEGEK